MTDTPLSLDELPERLMEVFDLVGPLYRRAQRQIEQDGADDGIGLPPVVRAVLDLLRVHGPMTVPQLARTQSISRQFVQRVVNDAAGHGLVEAVPNPAHQRSSLITLTDSGLGAITAVVAREHARLLRAGEGLTGQDIDTCMQVLTRLLGMFGDTDTPPPRV